MTQIYVPGACSVAIKCKDGVVLGNDTRITWGYSVSNKNTRKVFKITEKIGITAYGLVGDFQNLVQTFRAQANLYVLREGSPISCHAMAKMISNYLFQRKMNPLFINVTVAGIDKDKPQVWATDQVGSLMPDDYAVGGSGATMAIGILETEYKPDMTVEQGEKLMEKCIRAAIKRDASIGNGIDILTITKEGAKEKTIRLTELGE
jgi:proteasome beta subunit